MDNLKEIRWKQRFENFEKTYKLLKKYSSQSISTELEKEEIQDIILAHVSGIEQERNDTIL